MYGKYSVFLLKKDCKFRYYFFKHLRNISALTLKRFEYKKKHFLLKWRKLMIDGCIITAIHI